MLTIEQENFFQIVEIESISESLEVLNCIDLTVEDDESFVIGNGIISHNSAMGSILQKRDPKKEAVYALKGKIKNARSLSDLSDNREILELMQILNLDPEGQHLVCPYEKVVIATDPDCLHGDTLIACDKGARKISDINIGDMVLTHNNRYREVVRVNEKISEEYIEISVAGNIIKCTPDHKLPVYRDGVLILERAKFIKNTDFILTKP
jgi:hypothetical protein